MGSSKLPVLQGKSPQKSYNRWVTWYVQDEDTSLISWMIPSKKTKKKKSYVWVILSMKCHQKKKTYWQSYSMHFVENHQSLFELVILLWKAFKDLPFKDLPISQKWLTNFFFHTFFTALLETCWSISFTGVSILQSSIQPKIYGLCMDTSRDITFFTLSLGAFKKMWAIY